LSTEPPSDVFLSDVKMEHTLEANIDEQIEIDCDPVSKVKDDFEAVVCFMDPKNSD